MRRTVGPHRTLVGLTAALLLLGAGCAMRSQTTTQGAPAAAEGLLIITDNDGNLLGVAPFRQTQGADQIVIKTSEVLLPEDLVTKVTPEKSFASEFRTITLFGMGNPCRYVIQGGKAVKKCTKEPLARLPAAGRRGRAGGPASPRARPGGGRWCGRPGRGGPAGDARWGCAAGCSRSRTGRRSWEGPGGP